MFEATAHVVKKVSKYPQAVPLAVYYILCTYKFPPKVCNLLIFNVSNDIFGHCYFHKKKV
jgi:hypothetical protein